MIARATLHRLAELPRVPIHGYTKSCNELVSPLLVPLVHRLVPVHWAAHAEGLRLALHHAGSNIVHWRDCRRELWRGEGCGERTPATYVHTPVRGEEPGRGQRRGAGRAFLAMFRRTKFIKAVYSTKDHYPQLYN